MGLLGQRGGRTLLLLLRLLGGLLGLLVRLHLQLLSLGLFLAGDLLVLLLQNAFKYTHASGQVTLTARAENGRVLIEVEDECGGLSRDETEK